MNNTFSLAIYNREAHTEMENRWNLTSEVVVASLKNIRDYLIGTHFIILIDSNAFQ